MLQTTLREQRWRGLVIAFDWPSDNSTLNYLEDRADAAEVANRMVSDAVGMLVDASRTPNIPARSTSICSVIPRRLRDHGAFSQAVKQGALFKADWRVAQVALIGGDIASESLRASKRMSRPMFDRCVA